jgi:starch phosphorylase
MDSEALNTSHEDRITQLALDLRWRWNHFDELWRDLEPELWDGTRNP